LRQEHSSRIREWFPPSACLPVNLQAMHAAPLLLVTGFRCFQTWAHAAVSVPLGAKGSSLPSPRLDIAFMADPRHGSEAAANVSVVGFYFPSHSIKVDMACGAPFLGNFWTPARIEQFAPPDHASDPHTFNCSEACYWASQWWGRASDFERLNGQQAFDMAQKLRAAGVPADPTYGGFGSVWRMMRAILRKKFRRGSELAAGLLTTWDAYLVEHQEGLDSDSQWSDYCDGTGENLLGLQLMALRDELRGNGAGRWSAFAAAAYDPESGVPRAGQEAWRGAVGAAAAALNRALPYKCPPRVQPA